MNGSRKKLKNLALEPRFLEVAPGAYQAAKDRKILDKVCVHMKYKSCVSNATVPQKNSDADEVDELKRRVEKLTSMVDELAGKNTARKRKRKS